MAINKQKKEKQKNPQSNTGKTTPAPQSVGRAPVQYIRLNSSQAKKDYDNGLTLATRRADGGYNYYQKDNNPAISSYYKAKNISERGTGNTYSFTGKSVDEMSLAEYTAYLRNSEQTRPEDYTALAAAIEDPTHRFYNPYWGKRVVQNSAAENFLREYFGGYDGEFDEAFFEQTSFLADFELRDGNTSMNIQSPGSKGTKDQWAAYYRIQLQNDMSKQKAVDDEWNDLRSKMQSAYKDHYAIYEKAPSFEELMSYIDMSDYDYLKKIDDSRNLDWGTSSAPVELNIGTWYSQEALAGVYNALTKGKDVSEDREYFEDAVEYYMQPVKEAASRNDLLQARGIDVTGWTDEKYATEMSAARASGDMELYDTLKNARYVATPKIASLADDADYITPVFGAYISDDVFDRLESKYGSYWPMLMDADGNVKRPSSKDGLAYMAAYQAWEIWSKKEFTQAAEAESDAFTEAVADLADYKSDFEDFETFEAYARGILDDGSYENLKDYLKDESKSARTLQINNEFIDRAIREAWAGASKESPVSKKKDTSLIDVDDSDVDEAPPLADEGLRRTEQEAARKQKDDEIKIASSLAALSSSGNPVSLFQIIESGIPAAPVAAMEEPGVLEVAAALWNQSGLGRGDASDPVVKMLTGDAAIEDVQPTIDDVFNLVTIRDIAHASGEQTSVFDGILAGAINDIDALYGAIVTKFSNLDRKSYLKALDSNFNVKHYNNAYNRAIESGYERENAAAAALDAMIYGSDEFDNMAAVAQGDELLEGAAQALTENLITEEGYIDSVETIAPAFEESVLDDDPEIGRLAKETSGAMLLGMSLSAMPQFQNETKEIVNDIVHGDITSQDVKSGLSDFLKRVGADFKNVVETRKQNKDELLPLLGMSSHTIGTEKYDALSDEEKAEADKIWNQASGTVTNKNEIIQNILLHATTDGHAERYGTGENWTYLGNEYNNITGNDTMMWLGTAVGITGNAVQEMYKVRNDLYNYGEWFTYDEAYALRTAWETGFITYDSLHEIVVDRVSQYSREYLNGISNPEEIARGVQTANSTIDEIEASINHNIKTRAIGLNDALVGAAKSAQDWISGGADAVSTVQAQNGLAEVINLDRIIAENEDEAARHFAIVDALDALVENSEMQFVIDDNSGYDYTLDQTEELRKLVKLYEQFGAYGSDMLICADSDPSFLKQYGVDLEAVGLKGSATDYMDDLTGLTWRNAYGGEGTGLWAALNIGVLQGIQTVGNVPAVLSRWAKEVFTDYEYEEGDGTYYDQVSQVSKRVDARLEAKSTWFEKFAAGILREYSSNQFTGMIGAAIGGMADSVRFKKSVAKAIKTLGKGASPEKILDMASASFKATRAIDSTKIISRLPFAMKVFTSSYEEHADSGRSPLLATGRAAIDVAIELFTETAAVDDRLNAIRSRIIPGLDAVSDADVCFITKLTGDAFNEIGQEELSLVMGRIIDVFENYDGSQVKDVGDFFSALGDSIAKSAKGMGQEAVATAVSTFFTTLLGTATTYTNSNTRKMLNRKRMDGGTMTAAELEAIAKVAVDDIFSGSSEEGKRANRKSALASKVEGIIRGDSDGANIEDDIAASMTAETAAPAAEAETAVPEESAAEQGKEPEAAQKPGLPAPDPNLTPGAAKISVYAEKADQNKADAIGKQVEESTYEELMAEDTSIASAQKALDAAAEKVNAVSQAVEKVRIAIQNKKRQLGMIYSASFGEGLDFNSPNVQNSVVANQQETAALESDIAEYEEELQAALREEEKAEAALEEAREKVDKVCRPQAQSAGKDAAINWLERREAWREENEKPVAGNTDNLESEAIRQGVGYERDNGEEITTEEREYSMYNRLTEPAPPSKAGEVNTYDEELGSEYDESSSKELYKADDEDNSFDRVFAEMDENDRYDAMENSGGKNRKQKGRTIKDEDQSKLFDYLFTNLYDMFKNFSRQSKSERTDYMVPVSGKFHHMLLGFFDRIQNGKQYKKLFLSDSDYVDPASMSTVAYSNITYKYSEPESSESLPLSPKGDREIGVHQGRMDDYISEYAPEPESRKADRKKGVNVKDRTKMDYLYLVHNLGLKPVAESANEIIINVSGTERGTTELTQKYAAMVEKAKREFAEAGRVLREKQAALNDAQGDERKAAVRAYGIAFDNYLLAESNVRVTEKAYTMAKNSEQDAYEVYSKADVQEALERFDGVRAMVDANARKRIEYMRTSMSPLELQQEAKAVTDYEGVSEDAIKVHDTWIERASSGTNEEKEELLAYINEKYRDAEYARYRDSILASLQTKHLKNREAMRAYITKNGGWTYETGGKAFDNLETNKQYYAHAGLLNVIHRYANQFIKAGVNVNQLTKEQLNEAIEKLVTNSDKLQATESIEKDWEKADARNTILGLNDVISGPGYRYAPVDVTNAGTLKANTKVGNESILNANGQYSASQAVSAIKEAYKSLRKAPKENPYHVWVQIGNEKRKIGAWQQDLGRRYYPSMEELFNDGVTIRMFHKDDSGKRDVDFVFEASKDEGLDVVKKSVLEMGRALNDLLSGTESTATAEQVRTYAVRYLEAIRKRMQYELTDLITNYRHNGKKWTEKKNSTSNDRAKTLRDGIGQIDRALKNDELLGQYLSEMKYGNGKGLTAKNGRALGKQLIQDYASRLNNRYKADAPEVQAAAAVAEAMPETSEDYSKEEKWVDDFIYKHANRDVLGKLRNPAKNYPDIDSVVEERIRLRTLMGVDRVLKGENRALQRLNLRMDDLLTEGMTAEEKMDYYTRKAEEAERVDADRWRFNEYQNRILEAAGVIAYNAENSDLAHENEAAVEGEEVVEEIAGDEKNAATTAKNEDSGDSDNAEQENAPENAPDPETEVNIPEAEEVIEAEENPEVREALEDMKNAGEADEEIAPIEINDRLFITINRRGKPVVDEAKFAEVEKTIHAQTIILDNAQAEVNAAFADMRDKKAAAKEYQANQKELKKLKADAKKIPKDTAEWYAAIDAYNEAYTNNMTDTEGREANQAYIDAIKAKDEAVKKRDEIKKMLNNNRRIFYGNKVVADYLKNRSFGSAYGTVYGAFVSPVQFARSVLNELKKSGWQYGNLTTKSRLQLAGALAKHLNEKMYENNRAAALSLNSTIHEFERKAAEFEYENALILKRISGFENAEASPAKRLAASREADNRILEARRNLLNAYKATVSKETNSEADLAEYREKIRAQVKKANAIAQELIDKYHKAGHTLENLKARSAKFSNTETGYIAQLRNSAAEMAASRDALFDMSMKIEEEEGFSSGIFDAISGRYGGRMPVYMVDLMLGILLDVSEGKTSNDKEKIRTGMYDLLNKAGATRAEIDMVADAYENHLTVEQISAKYGHNADRVNELMAVVSAERTKLLNKFSNPAAIFSKNFDAPERTIDFFFGDYAPIVKTLLYDPARDAERSQEIEYRKKIKLLKRDKLNKEQRAYAHRAIHEGFADEQIAKDRPNDYGAIKRTIDTAKDIFKETGLRLNIVEKRNGLELTNLIENYAHTFREGESNWILKALGLSRHDNAIPIELIGKTADFKPIHKYMSSHEHREGNETDFDIYRSVEKYLPAVLNTIHQTDNIVRMKQISEALEGVNRGEQGENKSFDYDQNGKRTGGRMVYFKEWLDRLAKNATGKASDIDREAEAKFGRNIRTWTNAIKRYRTLALLAANFRSAMTNTLVLAKVASLHPIETFTSLCATVAQVFGHEDRHIDFIKENSLRYQARSSTGEDERPSNKVGNLVIAPAEFIDKISTLVLQRTLYVSELKNSWFERQALAQAEDIASRLQADKTKLTRPELYNSNIASTILQFTQESINDLMFTVKDMPKYAGGNPAKYIAQLIFGYLLYSIYNDVFNTTSAADPIGSVYRAINSREEDESVIEIALNAAKSMADSLNPYSDIIDDGFEGVPVVGGVKKVGDELVDVISDAKNPEEWMQFGAALLGFVPGGNQAQRTIGGIRDVTRGYATSQSGKVRYAIDANPAKYVTAGLFGSSSLPDANEYFNSNYSGSMSGSSAELFKSLVGKAKKQGLLPSDLFRAIKANTEASAMTSEADNIGNRADSTSEERRAAKDAAKEARQDVTVPEGLASWAEEDALAGNPDSEVGIGIELYRIYGVKTYPTEFASGASQDSEEPDYSSYEGMEYPVDESVYKAMNAEMKVSYKRFIRAYSEGKYGTPNTQIAAENLEAALAKEKNRIRKRHMGAVAENFGGGINGKN